MNEEDTEKPKVPRSVWIDMRSNKTKEIFSHGIGYWRAYESDEIYVSEVRHELTEFVERLK